MMRWPKLVIPALLILLLAGAWAVVFIFTARSAVEEFFADPAAAQHGQVREFAENMVEFGPPEFEIEAVQPVSLTEALVEVVLTLKNQQATVSLSLHWGGGEWKIDAPKSRLVVELHEQPRLVLQMDTDSLSKPLQSLGHGKLLTVQPQAIEVASLGWIETSPYYIAHGEGNANTPTVGTEVELFAHKDKLAAAVAKATAGPPEIRVNITTTNHESIYHDHVEIRSPVPWHLVETVTGRRLDLQPGTVSLLPRDDGIVLSASDGEEFFAHRLVFPGAESKLELVSISRSGEEPKYRGNLEVANFEGSLVIVNELDLEHYLYAVLPSEMPLTFGTGALEIQAVVARTFAMGNMLSSAWQSTSAHVVDSVLSQVYNNTSEQPAAIAAVDSTAGEIVRSGTEPADLRFFSTSSGYTASSHQVWADSQGFPGTPIPWLSARPQYPGEPVDFDTENAYANFIHSPPQDAYDQNSPWFRWHVSFPMEQLAEIIDENLKDIHASEPSAVLKKESGKYTQVANMPAEPLGELIDLIPARRGDGGILMAVDIIGTQGEWRVSREYYIRHLLRPQGTGQQPLELVRHDGSVLVDFSLLPSAHIVWELDKEANQVTIHGGGFGHGVGMSQYGVRELSARGWSREEIIQHYFPGTELVKGMN